MFALLIGFVIVASIGILVCLESGISPESCTDEQFEEDWEAYNEKYPNSFDSDEG